MSEYYDSISSDINNMSCWLPKLQQANPFAGFKIPRTTIVKVPEEIFELFFMEKDGMTQQEIMVKIMEWVQNEFVPKAESEIGYGMWFVKNGGFSNKFDFKTCRNVSGNILRLTANIIDINYAALVFEAGGNAELVARQYIPAPDDVPTIYDGMPLRCEVRVFYDFDHHTPLYAANYWDWDYCYDGIGRNPSDKVVYEAYYPAIKQRYEEIAGGVMKMAENGLRDVEGLSGVWSVDFMEEYKGGQIWLIDMATGPSSAYWNKEKVKEAWKEKGIEANLQPSSHM